MSSIFSPGKSTGSTSRHRRRATPAVNKCVVALALLGAGPICAPAQTAAEPAVELRLERQLTPATLERIGAEDFAATPTPVAPTPTTPVAADAAPGPPPFTMLPALGLAAFFLALAAFGAGVMAGRRGRVTARNATVQLRGATGDAELIRTRDELADARDRNAELSAELERLAALQRAHDATATLEALQLHDTPAETELDRAHATIDELRAELEVLRGAESDLERDKRFVPDDDSVEAMHEELERRQQHIRELEALMHDVRTERDAMTGRLTELEHQADDLARTLAERDHELKLTSAELASERARAPEPASEDPARIEALERELETLQSEAQRAVALSGQLDAQAERAAMLEEQLEKAMAGTVRLAELEREVTGLRDTAAQAGQLQAQVAELEHECATQRRELDELGALAQAADDKERRIEALERELASRLEEIEALRAEPVQLGAATPAGLEEEFAASQSYARELEDRVERLQAHIHQLEQVLRHDEDVTTQLELGSPVLRGDQDSGALAAALERSERRVADLEKELQSARAELGAGGSASDAEGLHRENVRLSALAVQRNHELADLRERLAAIETQDARVGEWTSTVSSLENELRRKTTLLDAQADEKQAGEQRTTELERELERLRGELASSAEENDSLRKLLSDSRAAAAALRSRLHDTDDETIRMRLEPEHADGFDPPVARTPEAASADIETLRFTIDSRRDLAASLGKILEQEQAALKVALERVQAREEMLLALEDDIAGNRVTIAAMQNRLARAKDVATGTQPEKLELELQRSVRAMAKLRTDVLAWRRRVRPLHEAVVLRDGRIRNLETEVGLLREAKLGVVAAGAPAATRHGEEDPAERVECLEEIERLRAQIDAHEQALAETGVKLSRALAAEEATLQRHEDLEAARAAQLLRLDELHHELASLGVDITSGDDNVVDIRAHKPS